MITFLFLGLVLVFIALVIWIVGLLKITDWQVPLTEHFPFRKVLVIFPHPDDEVLTAGGLLQLFAEKGIAVKWVVLTKGEKGTPDAHEDLSLKEIRTREAEAVKTHLGISELVLYDLGDGELINKRTEVKQVITQELKSYQPDLVITYDEAGLYGHNDHIMVAEETTAYVKKHLAQATLWYVSFPQTILQNMKLPEHMATDKEYHRKRLPPTHKIFVGPYLVNKIKALYLYKSQLPAFQKNRYAGLMPYFLSMNVFEYFHQAQPQPGVGKDV